MFRRNHEDKTLIYSKGYCKTQVAEARARRLEKNTFRDERLKKKLDGGTKQLTVELMSPWDFANLSDEAWNKNMPSCMIKK